MKKNARHIGRSTTPEEDIKSKEKKSSFAGQIKEFTL
jgi:hypothetical protein